MLLLCGCAVGPNYSKPEIPMPPAYKEAGDWVVAKPADTAPRGKWWEVFNDPALNALEEQVEAGNQTLRESEARYRQAHAAVEAARAQLFPTLGASANGSRSGGGGQSSVVARRYDVSLDARWEVDLWGGVRRQIESSRASEEASAADLAAARLSLQAQLATAYFQLRVVDSQRTLLTESVKAFQASYDVTQNRYKAGVAARVDVVLAESQVRSTQAQAIDLELTRTQLEHAIAVLIGRSPAGFVLEPAASFKVKMPTIPPGLPSTLLERRPDIAAAERRVAAANAQVGVAQAAYFPALTLSGSGGFASNVLPGLFSAPNRFWSLGLGLADTILDFGTRSAQVESARGAYDLNVATYRQTVLSAFQEVEDNLAAARIFAAETEVQDEATRLARETVVLTQNQYRAGTASLLNVVVVQASQLSEERSTSVLLGRQLTSMVALIRAIGGSWEPAP